MDEDIKKLGKYLANKLNIVSERLEKIEELLNDIVETETEELTTKKMELLKI